MILVLHVSYEASLSFSYIRGILLVCLLGWVQHAYLTLLSFTVLNILGVFLVLRASLVVLVYSSVV